jgi:hypothetical protein
MHIAISPNHNKREGFCFWVRHDASWCDVKKTDSKSAEGNLVGVRPPPGTIKITGLNLSK